MLKGMSMGVLERIENIVKANLGDMLAKTEDPEGILKQLISEMESELVEAREQMAETIREGKRLKALCIENERLAERWHEKAVLAVQQGKDGLAREALLRKRSAAALSEEYGQEYNLYNDVLTSLKSALKSLETKIQEAKRKRSELIIERKRSEIDQLLGRNLVAESDSTFRRMEDRIIALDAEVEAMAEVSGDELTTKQREDELEAELAKLKSKLKSEKS